MEAFLPPEEVAITLGWPAEKVAQASDALNQLTRDRLEAFVPADHYAEYCVAADGLARKALVIYDNDKAAAIARVNALNLVASLLDRKLKTGQELGLIERAARKVQVAGAFVLSEMSGAELRKFLGEQLQAGSRVLRPPPVPLLLDDGPGEPAP